MTYNLIRLTPTYTATIAGWDYFRRGLRTGHEMCEIIIRAKEHWMEKLSQGEIDALCVQYENFLQKLALRPQRGDFLEVRENGYFSQVHGWNKEVFALIKIPSMSVEDAKYLTESKYEVLFEGTEYEESRLVTKCTHRLKVGFPLSAGQIITINATVLNQQIENK